MALKKSELYSSIWQSCDALRGGMDASQYKDYVLVLLFVKYVSDKYAGKGKYAPVQVPAGASFADMVALKGNKEIGDLINKRIIGPLAKANHLSDMPDFADANKLGSGKEMVDRLTDLIAIFENPALDFSQNRADGDDILGDAYEYLMRHFATQSGKSKGQFYTPSEVSRLIAGIFDIRRARISASTTVYDPTCGSGSLLLKVSDAAIGGSKPTLYGQEKDSATAGLARMNMVVHDTPHAAIVQGNTLADPKFKESDALKRFDYVVANPPFSDKRWSTGLTLGKNGQDDPYHRFPWGTPPDKQGDYAYLLHIISSMKSTGKAACILPHGVLFRGNAEAAIREMLVRSGYLKGIIGLPANLFFGTGIPACILVLDKENATARRGIFMIDASKGFIKDGPKNRLRERDIHRITDTFLNAEEHPRYSRLVPHDEIVKNDYNLNLPRYIDTQEPEDIQDIAGHLRGGIPDRDIDALADYWQIAPGLRKALFRKNRACYSDLKIETAKLKTTILAHPEFDAFLKNQLIRFELWRESAARDLRRFKKGGHPKQFIYEQSEIILAHFEQDQHLLDAYAVYQHLMDYWAGTMQDDAYLIAADGWTAKTERVLEEIKSGKNKGLKKDKGWTCNLIPKPLIVARYFAPQQTALDALQTRLDATAAGLAELEEEHGGEEGILGALEKLDKSNVKAHLKELKNDRTDDARAEIVVLKKWLKLSDDTATLRKQIREADEALDRLAYEKYPKLTEAEIKALIVDDKWLATLEAAVTAELDRIAQTLTTRIRQLADRYATPLPELVGAVADYAAKVEKHLEKMGVS